MSLYASDVSFATDKAQPLNKPATLLVEEGHGVVKGRAQYFFDNGKVMIEVEHEFTYDDIRWTDAQFLIARDDILLND